MIDGKRTAVCTGIAAAAVLSVALPALATDTDPLEPEVEVDEETPQAPGTYSWEDLVELIPELKESVPPSTESSREPSETPAVPMICERKPEIGTRLATRKCYTFEQWVRKECVAGVRTAKVPDWCRRLAPGGK